MSILLSKEKIIEIVLESTRIEEKFVRKSDQYSSIPDKPFHEDLIVKVAKLEREVEMLKKSSIELSDGQINIIVDRVLECLRLNQDEQSESAILPSDHLTFKYPPSITKTGFPNNFSEEKGDTYFGFFNIRNDVAEFQYCGDDFERAKANKTELEIACEISGTTVGADKILNVENGTVVLQDNKWVVTKKAKIKFE